MEAQSSRLHQITESTEQNVVQTFTENITCGGPTCGLSSKNADSDEAKERSASIRKLLIAVVLCLIFMCVEVVGGIKANSLAILTDAAHLLSDVAAFAISLFSIWAAEWEATPRQSYGFYRIEILGAFVSIQLIWLLTGILVFEAIKRLVHGTREVHGVLMFAVAAFGLLVNIIMAVLLGHNHGHGHGGHDHDHDNIEREGNITTNNGEQRSEKKKKKKNDHHRDHDHDHDRDHINVEHQDDGSHGHAHNIDITANIEEQRSCNKTEKKKMNVNIRSAYLHVLGDSVQSVGVMVGGGIIWYKPQWKVVDLLCTLMFSLIVLMTTINMLRNILGVLMESTPREVDATRLERGLCEVEGVVAVHELHIWAITIGKVLLACHVIIKPEANAEFVLDQVIGYIRKEYNISHVTVQIEREKTLSLEISASP